jgi:hypothetical protein
MHVFILTPLWFACTGASDVHSEPQRPELNREELPWFLCRAPLLSDSDLDHEWMGEFEDFPPDENDVPPSPADSYTEDPIAELGLYDENEDLRGWSFKELYDDSQWQEHNLTLKNTPHRFTGPVPGVCISGDPVREPCLAYFLRFWPDGVLQCIADETNK